MDGAGNHLLAYADLTSVVLSETNSSGTLAGLRITNGYDGVLRRTSLTFFTNASSAVFTDSYAYDAGSRLTNVSRGRYSVSYKQDPFFGIWGVDSRSSGTMRMSRTNAFSVGLPWRIHVGLPGASATMRISNEFNSALQLHRSSVSEGSFKDGSYWTNSYDSLEQLSSSKKYWSDGTIVAGQQFEYGFDDIGNRKWTKAGGDSSGSGLRTANYSVNALNQYTSRDVPGTNDIIGTAHAAATVMPRSVFFGKRRENPLRCPLDE